MDLANFLNQIEEQEVGGKGTQTEEQILQEVIDEHIEEALGVSVTDQDADNENQPERPIYTIQDARQAVQVLIDFAETQDDLSTAHSRAMERIEQELERITISSRRQLTLDRWIT
jgi:tRNA U34 5-carboxymethylaminomethyl modifying GTPase MnmE/TrmE